MDTNTENCIIELQKQIREARNLSEYHKEEMQNNPGNFLYEFRYNSFKAFLAYLEEELDKVLLLS